MIRTINMKLEKSTTKEIADKENRESCWHGSECSSKNAAIIDLRPCRPARTDPFEQPMEQSGRT